MKKPGVPLTLIPTYSTETLAIGAPRARINDSFKLPLAFDELESHIKRCLAGNRSHVFLHLCDPPTPRLMLLQPMIGESLPVQRINAYIDKVAMTNSTVLITGERGMSKELVAEMIHHTRGQHAKPLVGIHCAALRNSLFESELFGYAKGAFTEANALKEGQLQLVEADTVFVGGIGDMSPHVQAKILRAIESKTICRLRGKRGIPINVRIIAATNQEIEQFVAAGKFHLDLYFRLNVGRIHRQPSDLDHSPENECKRVLSALLRTNWNMSQAAQQPSWSRMTLYRKLRKYHIVKSAPITRLSVSATSSDLPSAYVSCIVPPASDREQDDRLSCSANGNNGCVNQEV